MAKEQAKSIQQLAAEIAQNTRNLFLEDSEHYIGDVTKVSPDALFMAFLLADLYTYRQLTGKDDGDIIDYTHMLNRLAIQYGIEDAVKKAKETGEKEAKDAKKENPEGDK